MNNVNLTGTLLYRPDIKQVKGTNVRFSDFVISVNNQFEDKKLSHCSFVYVNCRAYGDLCDYLFRNCYQGTIIEIDGQLASYSIHKDGEQYPRFINIVIARRLIAISKSQIVLEGLDEFIKKYDMAKIKSQLNAKKRQEKEELEALKETIFYEGEKEDNDGETKDI